MPLKTFAIDELTVVVGGATISGFADGSAVEIDRNEDAYTLSVGADGEPSRSKNLNRSGVITITLASTSDSNDVLAAFAALDEVDNSGVVPVLVKDGSGRAIFASAEGWIRRVAPTTYTDEITDKVWAIECGSLESAPLGN